MASTEKPLAGEITAALAEATAQGRVAEQVAEALGEGLCVAGLDQEAVLAIADDLRDTTGAGGDDRDAGRRGLEQGDAEPLHVGWMDQQVETAEHPLEVVAETGEGHPCAEPEGIPLGLEGGTPRTLSEQQDPIGGRRVPEAGEGVEEHRMTLAGDELGDHPDRERIRVGARTGP